MKKSQSGLLQILGMFLKLQFILKFLKILYKGGRRHEVCGGIIFIVIRLIKKNYAILNKKILKCEHTRQFQKQCWDTRLNVRFLILENNIISFNNVEKILSLVKISIWFQVKHLHILPHIVEQGTKTLLIFYIKLCDLHIFYFLFFSQKYMMYTFVLTIWIIILTHLVHKKI